MYRKCNIHLLENHVLISGLFENLKNELDTKIVINIPPVWKMPKITENSTIGEQIKYYRRLANVKQSDLCEKIGCERGALMCLENKDIKLANTNVIKGVIKELNIENKIIINDDYVSFTLNNPSKEIVNFRKKNKLKVIDLSKMIKTETSVIKRWESGKAQITRKSYDKLKKYMFLAK